MKLPSRLPYEFLLIALLMLGSCDGPNAVHKFSNSDYDRLDDADTNARNALEKTEDLETRLKAVEDKLHMDEG